MLFKKVCKFFSFFSFSIGFIIFFRINQTENIIENKIRNVKKSYEMTEYTKVPYLVFENYQKECLITNDTSKISLDQNYVGIWNENKKLEEVKNIVLAGHNISSVFHILHYIQKGDELTLYYKNYVWKFRVEEMKTISSSDFSNFMETEKKQVTLITCTNDKTKRYIVIAHLIE